MEDGFESDIDFDQVELCAEYRDLLEKADGFTFTVLLCQRYSTENILDEVVEFPVLDVELDNGNSNINVSPTTSTGLVSLPNIKQTVQPTTPTDTIQPTAHNFY